MAIADLASLLAKQASPTRTLNVESGGVSPLLGSSVWRTMTYGGSNPAIPSTAAVPTCDTLGSPGYDLGCSGLGTARIVRIRGRAHSATGEAIMVQVVDRLSHQGGLSGTVTTPQTTNLPTAAIPARDVDTTGKGVHALAEIYTTLGTSASPNCTISYTNSAGVAGQVSPIEIVGGTSWNTANAAIWLPVAAGDKGVRSVESVTLSQSSGVAGNFGITLVRPLLSFVIFEPNFVWDPLLDGGGVFPAIPAGACLGFYLQSSATANSPTITLRMVIDIAED